MVNQKKSFDFSGCRLDSVDIHWYYSIMQVNDTRNQTEVQAMKILGISDEVTTCECCGRKNLKRTVVLSCGEGEVHYGSQCAADALRAKGLFWTKKDVERLALAAKEQRAATRPCWGVVNETTGRVVTQCMTREDAESGVRVRGNGYFVARI